MSSQAEHLPAYSEQHGHLLEAGDVQLPTHYGSLNLAPLAPSLPSADACLAHLRLLHTFEKLKTAVGYQDGLWDIWDSRAASAANPLDVLVKLREKRWALYVGRAVERYESWWRSFVPDMLLEKDMIKQQSSDRTRYEGFTEGQPAEWAVDMLPPIGKRLYIHLSMAN